MPHIHTHSAPISARRQTGAALITGLIFLVILSIIGVTAARMSSLEERMSGNMRDRLVAMQAAELALRDAERDITRQGTPGDIRNPPISGLSDFAVECDNDSTDGTDDDGLCYRPGSTSDIVSNTEIEWPTFTYSGTNYAAFTLDMTAAPSVAYGTYTGEEEIPVVAEQPRYIIEGIKRYCWRTCGATETVGYRITVRAVGANPNTVVWLQETYKP